MFLVLVETLFQIMYILVWVTYLWDLEHVQQTVGDVQVQMFVLNVSVPTRQQPQVLAIATLLLVSLHSLADVYQNVKLAIFSQRSKQWLSQNVYCVH